MDEKTRVLYRRARVSVEVVRPCMCQACQRIGRVELHHWRYAYKTKVVRKLPQLALDNTSWLCFTCHNLADSLRAVRDADVHLVGRLERMRAFALDPTNRFRQLTVSASTRANKKREGL